MKKSQADLSGGDSRQPSTEEGVDGTANGGGNSGSGGAGNSDQGRPSGSPSCAVSPSIPCAHQAPPEREQVQAEVPAQLKEQHGQQQQQQTRYDVDMAVESDLLEVLVPSCQQPTITTAITSTAATTMNTITAAAAPAVTGVSRHFPEGRRATRGRARSAEGLGSSAVLLPSVAVPTPVIGEHGRRETWPQEVGTGAAAVAAAAARGSGNVKDYFHLLHPRSGIAIAEAETVSGRRRTYCDTGNTGRREGTPKAKTESTRKVTHDDEGEVFVKEGIVGAETALTRTRPFDETRENSGMEGLSWL